MADDLTSSCTFKRIIPGTLVQVETPATADDTDYFTMTIADYGFASIEAVQCYRHTTTDSVIVSGDDPTTAVATGVLTVTLGGSTDNKKRTVYVWGNAV